MLLRLLIIFFFLAKGGAIRTQPIQSKIINRLLREEQAVTHIHHNEFRGFFLDRIDSKFKKNQQYLLKTSTELFLGLEGTGCLYKVVEADNGLIDIVRIDSTVYAGNNFCAANFIIDSAIYSFGGYGFWRTNGLLKTFNSFSKEWDVIPLSDEKPSIFCQTSSGVFWNDMDSSASNTRKYGTAFAPSMFWVNAEKKLFFEITQRLVNEAIADSSVNFYNQFTPAVNVLDLRTKQWRHLGYLIDYGWHHLIQTPWGLLVMANSDNIYLADFTTNSRMACKEADMAAYRMFFMKDPPQVTFYADGYIYLGTIEGNSFDSIPFSLNHFTPSDKPLYREYKVKSIDFALPELLVSPWFLYPSGILVGVVLGFVLLGVFKNNLRSKDRSWKAIFNTSVSPAERVNMLTQTEKGLIELISNSSLKGRKVSIEEVNKVIGVAGKNEPIKRRVRSEVINSVNEKWMIISASREKLIESIKSPEDKRAREYFISTEILASPVFSALMQVEY
jgi:hypothetical protein